MALEAKLIYELEPMVPFDCAEATTIEKGSFVKITDENIVAITDGDTDAIIGITGEEKKGGDGRTSVGVYLRGVFKVFVGAAGATVGLAAISDTGTGAANELVNADINSENIVGRFLGTATDTQSVMFLLNPFAVNLA